MIQDLYNLSKHVASSDATRYHLNGVQVEMGASDDKRLFVATDGHIAAVIECDSDLDVGFYHSDVIKSAFKLSELNQDATAIGILKPDAAVKFPNWRSFVVKYDNTDTVPVDESVTMVDRFTCIAFNPDLLVRLKKGLGLRKMAGLKLTIKNETSGVYVTCANDDRYAVMMPMRAL